ncbi:MAG: VOC family protein [Acidobacteriota bacterium]
MPEKIDPLNEKNYGAVSTMLTVGDIKAAVSFYQKAFGFSKRGIMTGPGGQPIHAELTLRGTTLMLGPEMAQMGSRSQVNRRLAADARSSSRERERILTDSPLLLGGRAFDILGFQHGGGWALGCRTSRPLAGRHI